MVNKDPLKNKRIFVGFNSAGTVGIYGFSRVLKRRGYKIDFYGLNAIRYDMPVDILLKFSSSKIISIFQRLIYFFKILFKYDIWHLNFLECFFFYPLNLAILKLFGKKIILTCRGADVRDQIDFLPKNLFNKSSSWPTYYQKQMRRPFWFRLKQQIRIRIFCFLADKVVLTGPFLVSAVPHFDKIIGYSRDTRFLKKFQKKDKRVRVLHLPSEQVVKGTEIVERTFKKLQKKYPRIDFQILPPMPQEKLLATMAEADIVVDQLLVGWYGGQAVEALAMGKIVMAYLNPVYLAFSDVGRIPIWNTNAWSFEQDLENLLKVYLMIKEEWSSESLKFARKYHDSQKIAEEYLKIYRSAL